LSAQIHFHLSLTSSFHFEEEMFLRAIPHWTADRWRTRFLFSDIKISECRDMLWEAPWRHYICRYGGPNHTCDPPMCSRDFWHGWHGRSLSWELKSFKIAKPLAWNRTSEIPCKESNQWPSIWESSHSNH
jgi:hypothetical protein